MNVIQCDGTCHDEGRDDCPACGSTDWHCYCDECRFYAADDAR